LSAYYAGIICQGRIIPYSEVIVLVYSYSAIAQSGLRQFLNCWTHFIIVIGVVVIVVVVVIYVVTVVVFIVGFIVVVVVVTLYWP